MKLTYQTIIAEGVSPKLPGIYEWRIYGVEDRLEAVYVGKSEGSMLGRRRGHERAVAAVAKGGDGQTVHKRLFQAATDGKRTEWVCLENVADPVVLENRETIRTHEHRREGAEQGFEVLNDTFVSGKRPPHERWRKHQFFLPHFTVKRIIPHNPRAPHKEDYPTIEFYRDARTVQEFIDICDARMGKPRRGAHLLLTWDFTHGHIAVNGVQWPADPFEVAA